MVIRADPRDGVESDGALRGADIFILAGSNLRAMWSRWGLRAVWSAGNRSPRLPASFRHGRHRAAGGRRALRLVDEPTGTPPWTQRHDVDGHAEALRIAARRMFEDLNPV